MDNYKQITLHAGRAWLWLQALRRAGVAHNSAVTLTINAGFALCLQGCPHPIRGWNHALRRHILIQCQR